MARDWWGRVVFGKTFIEARSHLMLFRCGEVSMFGIRSPLLLLSPTLKACSHLLLFNALQVRDSLLLGIQATV